MPPKNELDVEALARIEAKLDKLLSRDSDEQIAGILAHVRKFIDDSPWFRHGLSVVSMLAGMWLLERLGVLTPEQHAAGIEAVAAHEAVALPAEAALPEPAAEAQPAPSPETPPELEPDAP